MAQEPQEEVVVGGEEGGHHHEEGVQQQGDGKQQRCGEGDLTQMEQWIGQAEVGRLEAEQMTRESFFEELGLGFLGTNIPGLVEPLHSLAGLLGGLGLLGRYNQIYSREVVVEQNSSVQDSGQLR